MILLEYEAKGLLRSDDIPVPTSYVLPKEYIKKPENCPVVLKSQVPTGGRGKAGGVKRVDSLNDFDAVAQRLFALPIKGHLPSKLLVEEALDITREFYLSISIDRDTAEVYFMANRQGGVEVESLPLDSFLRFAVADNKTTTFDRLGQELADYFGLPGHTFELQDILEKLYRSFNQHDASLIEINPLVLTSNQRLLAADAKINLDDAALFRHPEWHFETPIANTNFVILDHNGNVASMANGAGLAMATVDAIADAGLQPINFLDVGGGANETNVLESFDKIASFSQAQAIIVNIFGGITRCDEIAKAIVDAQQKYPHLPRLFIRLSGNNYDQACDILAQHSIPLLPDLTSCVNAARKEIIHD